MKATQPISLNLSCDDGIQDVLTLMRIQTDWIIQLHSMLVVACTDMQVINDKKFQEFTLHFVKFIQFQAGSMGFSQVVSNIQVCNFALLELLLDTQIVAAAEHLELAITSLEIAKSEPHNINNQHMNMLYYGLGLLEEVQFQIIALVESAAALSKQLYFPN